MTAPFQPGDVVVCVDAQDLFNSKLPSGLRLGGTYRVKRLIYDDRPSALYGRSPWDVDLVGISHPTGAHYGSPRFRKIDDEVTEEFREQLRKIPEPVA